MTYVCADGDGDGDGECAVDADCDDGVFCNGAEVCGLAGCGAGQLELSDGIDCALDECDEVMDGVFHSLDHSRCDDGVFCNGTEVCDWDLRGCTQGPAADLDDDISCTVDTCDVDTDQVVHTPNHGWCDDLEDCTTDYCDAVDGCYSVDDMCQ